MSSRECLRNNLLYLIIDCFSTKSNIRLIILSSWCFSIRCSIRLLMSRNGELISCDFYSKVRRKKKYTRDIPNIWKALEETMLNDRLMQLMSNIHARLQEYIDNTRTLVEIWDMTILHSVIPHASNWQINCSWMFVLVQCSQWLKQRGYFSSILLLTFVLILDSQSINILSYLQQKISSKNGWK